ncbi:isoprenyl transferase [Acetivibrio saccincola]|jgi:undecaprenyl diphosphate synthase|uniref:Isoprenyl transferase n=1 Tax=Acetivibrio saccincola TaxID=1677857 RepID=A0A2K9E0B8_9FIRM|nr:isoprenyl transferase [Acetivibrio saccincola]AUG57217.1 Ditrans,polycis-undecaprenyl-diphosphate synthase ((2E,6E)-farnesyl-diphosphate specific) [Acetivibrio saccincola]NLW26146.1 isoprenyl transferase [Acetivibrio saccincola]PQQ67196.1 isoprenyl transferase [Acetivibrio saccincola]HOA97154.1 isoprenyl transferase [Acetivibrio saccincola]HQD27858.1 isoprenyl transferase [Acetivibrio saccincola]
MSFIDRFFKKDKYINKLNKSKLPKHIAIIMDGNGRWAKRRGLPRTVGHREGAKTLKTISTFCGNIGIKYLTVYAFSTENWKRPKEEVDALMDLLLDYLKNAEKHIGGKDVRIQTIGDISVLSSEIQKEIERVTRETKNNSGLILNIALNYGGRNEMVHCVKSIVEKIEKGEITKEDINEEIISENLYTKDIPDPDILIRPGGESRLSNFLLWQAAYTEIWYTDVLWPDFREKHIIDALLDYQNRNRRFGGL